MIEQPGKFKFTRGIHAPMYRSKLWTMRQHAGFGEFGRVGIAFLQSKGVYGVRVGLCKWH